MVNEILFKVLTFPSTISIRRDNRRREKARKKAILTPADVNNEIKRLENKNLSDLEFSKAKADMVLQYTKNIRKKEEQKRKANKKIIEAVLDIAEDKTSSTCSGVDSDLIKKINNLQLLRDQYRYGQAAKHSQRLINYTIYRSTDPEAIGLDVLVKHDKEFINGICKEIHADPIYKDFGALDIELFDPWHSGWNDQKYLVNLSSIHNLVTVNMQDRFNRKLNANRPTTLSNNGGYCPVHFTATNGSPNVLVDPDLAVDSYNSSILEAAIAPYFEDGIPEHHYEIDGQNFKAVIKNPATLANEEFRFNIGYFGKDVVSMIKQDVLGTQVFVHPSCSDIWERCFSNCFYQLTENDTNAVYRVISPYYNLYDCIDLKSIPESEFLGGLDAKLANMIYQLQINGIVVTRFGFERYNGLNDFIMNGSDGSVVIYNGQECCYRLGPVYRSFQI